VQAFRDNMQNSLTVGVGYFHFSTGANVIEAKSASKGDYSAGFG
jgi:hypothetical protein